MHRKLLLFLPFILSGFIVSYGQAQDLMQNNSRGKTHKEYTMGKNVLSIGTVGVFWGNFGVHYERRPVQWLGLDMSAGITFRSFYNDLTFAIYSLSEQSNYFDRDKYRERSDLTDQYHDYNYRKCRLGYIFGVAPKIFFNTTESRSTFISVMAEWKRYNYKAQLADSNSFFQPGATIYINNIPRIDETMKEYMRCMDLSLNFGRNRYVKDHTFIGWTLGLGIRLLNAKRLDTGVISQGSVFRYGNATAEFKRTEPYVAFNLLIGGWF